MPIIPKTENKQNAIPGNIKQNQPLKLKKERSVDLDNSISREVKKQSQQKSSKGQSRPEIQFDSKVLDKLPVEYQFMILQAISSKTVRDAFKEQMENNKKTIEAQSKETLEKLDEQMKKIQEQEKKSLANKILGWLGAALAIVAGVATLMAGGAGMGLIVSGIAALAVMTLEETGVMDKARQALADDMTKMYVKQGMSQSEAESKAAIASAAIMGVAVAIVTIAPAIAGGGAGLVNLGMKVQKMARIAATVAKGVAGASAITTGGLSVDIGIGRKRAEELGADQVEIKAFMKYLNDENKEIINDLQTINEQVSKSYTIAMEILKSKIETDRYMMDSVRVKA